MKQIDKLLCVPFAEAIIRQYKSSSLVMRCPTLLVFMQQERKLRMKMSQSKCCQHQKLLHMKQVPSKLVKLCKQLFLVRAAKKTLRQPVELQLDVKIQNMLPAKIAINSMSKS